MRALLVASVIALSGCAARTPAPLQPNAASTEDPSAAPTPDPALDPTASCDASQVAISRAADARAAPQSIARHLATSFPDGQVAWLMKEDSYQKYVVATGAARWGRCNDHGCYLFAAPAAVIHDAVAHARRGDGHDAAELGRALGLPAANVTGPLRMMTLDVDTAGVCVRLPVDDDPGVWKCASPDATDCFKFGGYTSGGVPELMVIDAPVAGTAIEQVP